MDFQNTMMEALGIEMEECSPERCVATMPVDHRTRQPFGQLHGGASVALAETVASFGASQLIDQEKQACVGLEINANHIKSVQSGIVRAEATPLHIGRSTIVYQIEIKDENHRLICISRCTMAIITKR
ncbi:MULTISPECIES: hotdog fold thioesterase [Bacillus]|uniref:Esterase n=2 Tax=Bacillus TaxID=1386 RepID=A0A0M3R9X9_9BACI|nr:MULTISPECIES: hotdog fold thioesterase [Bacillus]ALC82206.1 esterase [Bacillus gobiensis]MBP1081044.1 uncharacterized protein (TIGR00369 family) [Bacillus capparidis]MED1095736.1 hotdog fold thioesterase [Bacillus capparidis]